MEIRKVECCIEPFISRIPGLFAYTKLNGAGISELHKASDREGGCYGMVPENIRIPVDLPTGVGNGTVVSYRTLFYYYYKYRAQLPETDPFIQFVERGIGRRKLVGFTDEQDLVPTYFYISMAKDEHTRMVQLKNIVDYYNNHTDKTSSYLCLKTEEYERLGGDKMTDLLAGFMDEANKVADEFYGYSDGLGEMEKSGYHIPLLIDSTIEDEGIFTPSIEEWDPKKDYFRGDIIFKDNHSMLCVRDTKGKLDADCDVVVFDEDAFIVNDDYKFPLLAADEYTVTGKTDSKLETLRRYSSHVNNETNQEDTPMEGVDWLFYYRVGYVYDQETLNDDLGNIGHIGDDMENGDDLYAYGNVITSITYNEADRTLTFTYWVGAHLKADFAGMTEDQDGNKYYNFRNFQLDITSPNGKYMGVKYTETYTYDEGSDLENLIKSGTFDQYIAGDFDASDNKKYEFNKNIETTEEHSRYDNGDEYSAQFNASNFEVLVQNRPDNFYAQLSKRDYFYGISLQPKRDIDVFIDRGNNALFEKRMKILEIKSITDLENYANGSYFNVQKIM